MIPLLHLLPVTHAITAARPTWVQPEHHVIQTCTRQYSSSHNMTHLAGIPIDRDVTMICVESTSLIELVHDYESLRLFRQTSSSWLQ